MAASELHRALTPLDRTGVVRCEHSELRHVAERHRQLIARAERLQRCHGFGGITVRLIASATPPVQPRQRTHRVSGPLGIATRAPDVERVTAGGDRFLDLAREEALIGKTVEQAAPHFRRHLVGVAQRRAVAGDSLVMCTHARRSLRGPWSELQNRGDVSGTQRVVHEAGVAHLTALHVSQGLQYQRVH